MSYVLEIVLALATLALPELGWGGGHELPWAVPLLFLVPYALGFAARRALLSGRFRTGAMLERLLVLAPVALQALAVTELGWLTTLERTGLGNAKLAPWSQLPVLLGLAPYLVFQVAAIDARARSLVFPPDTPGKLRAFQVRLFVAALVPFIAYFVGANLLSRSPEWRVRFEEVGVLGGSLAVVLIAFFLYGMPFYLRYAWDTAPIERGWARTMLEQVARSAGFQYRELLVWRTGQQFSNAAIVGFTGRSRLVFFSDLLLQQLGPRELAAVFAHEMGHARRAHSVVFGAFALGFFLGAQQLIEAFQIESELVAAGILLGLLALWYLAFGYLSRRFELEADLESLHVVGESGPLIRALELVTGAHAHTRSSWRHFSTRDRVAFLRSAELDPLVGLRLRRRLGRWRKLGYALFAAAALFALRDRARSWNEDWLVADLRLGQFEDAAERADSPAVDPKLAALARRAADVPEASRGTKDLAFAALTAWMRGDLAEAKDWLELARLRGAERVGPLIDALEAGEGAGTAPQTWQDVLRTLSEED